MRRLYSGKDAELAFMYRVGDEADRRNFELVCTKCGKIFKCNSREQADYARKEFKFCYDCGAKFGDGK